MRLFLDLIENLNQSKVEKDNVQALSYYFSNESPKEGLATLALLSQKKPARIAKTSDLKTWVLFEKSIPEWLY
jgi:DNA ligase-1